MILISTMMLILSVLFTQSTHPLTLGFILLIQSTMISSISGLLNINFWFSYILFLIMVGGMLVLFIYMTSIASNEMFLYSEKIIPMIMIIMIISMLIYMTKDQFLHYFNLKTNLNSVINQSSWTLSLSKYIDQPTNNILMFMINYLLIALIAVVKITNIQYGPLRQKN
uniref:NADH-ubiquinone oxidoreductase chain 6 n=1 Tax=Chrysochroa fulgidissima TaxID=543396 RepID=C5H687_9COLE|nr:NADH dehydrogenase subunit 6 [Chrysochroa fulgidissima]ACF04029.1 NADH dehydrogenase subunit 6 [Chrysochroa fulgidissima]